MMQDLFAFVIWLVARLERPLRHLCTPPLPAATVMRWWVHRLSLSTQPQPERPVRSPGCRPAALPYLLYPLSCTLLE